MPIISSGGFSSWVIFTEGTTFGTCELLPYSLFTRWRGKVSIAFTLFLFLCQWVVETFNNGDFQGDYWKLRVAHGAIGINEIFNCLDVAGSEDKRVLGYYF